MICAKIAAICQAKNTTEILIFDDRTVPQPTYLHNLLFHHNSQDSCKSLCTQTAFGEDKSLIWFDDDCERRRLIYIDEIQPGVSLPKWRRKTFINDLSSFKVDYRVL